MATFNLGANKYSMNFGAIGDFLNTAVPTALSYVGSKKAMAMQVQLAREQMAFQERMSNSVHQREVKDLMSAGLNPVLSANGGATTPAGSMATIGDSPETSAVNTALSFKHLKNETMLRNSQMDLNAANAASAFSQSAYTDEQQKQFNIFNPLIQRAIIDNYRANTAKSLSDAISNRIMAQEAVNMGRSNRELNLYRGRHYSSQIRLNDQNWKWYGANQGVKYFTDVLHGFGSLAGGFSHY